MKKIISLLLALLLVAALAVTACANGDTDTGADSEAAEQLGGEEEELTGEEAEPEKEGDDADGPILTTGAYGGEGEETGEDVAAAPDEPITVSFEGAPDYTVRDEDYYVSYEFAKVFDENGHFKDFRASDVVKLVNWDPMKLSEEEVNEKVDSEIEGILKECAEPQKLTDRAVADGDTVNIDYVGKVDGEEFSGGSTNGNGTEVTIGVTTYVEGFLDQLVGHMPGETFDIDVTFPEDFANADLAGKPAVFTITINYIVGEDVVPELDPDFIEENVTPFLSEVETVEDFRKYIRDNVLKDLIINQLISDCEYSEIPEEAYGFSMDLAVLSVFLQAKQYGVDVDTILGVYGYTFEDILNKSAESSLKVAKRMIAIQAIAEQRDDIKVTEEARVKFAKENLGSEDYAQAVELYGEGLFNMYVLQDVVLNWLEERVVVGEGAIAKDGNSGVAMLIVGAFVLVAAIITIVVVLLDHGKKTPSADQADGGEPTGEDETPEEDGLIRLGDVLAIEEADEEAEKIEEDASEEIEEAKAEFAEEAEKIEEAKDEIVEESDKTDALFSDEIDKITDEINEKTDE
ncbi:MAG: FKBP-type peptidyl-prolyl cis-trans isomerase [Clostridia bacterium]|nr:FKBP-type peptidyl-prolyl cis-trans isomerase [Clostridia bacterium]